MIAALSMITGACRDSTAPAFDVFLDEQYQAQLVPDIVYGTGDVLSPAPGEKDLLLDIYFPAGSAAPSRRPGIVLVHDGGFSADARSDSAMFSLALHFARRGYVAASIDHRLMGDDPPTHAIATDTTLLLRTTAAARVDAALAVQWLRENAATYGVDPGRIAIGGHGFGALTAMGAAYWDPGIQRADVDAVLSLSGGLFSAVDRIDAGEPPLLIIHGTSDGTISVSEAIRLANRAESVGLEHELYLLEGVDHDTPSILDERVGGSTIFDRIGSFMFEHLDLARCCG